MTTPQTQVISIWKRVVDVSEGLFFIKARQFFQVFLSSPLLSLYDMLLAPKRIRVVDLFSFL